MMMRRLASVLRNHVHVLGLLHQNALGTVIHPLAWVMRGRVHMLGLLCKSSAVMKSSTRELTMLIMTVMVVMTFTVRRVMRLVVRLVVVRRVGLAFALGPHRSDYEQSGRQKRQGVHAP